MWSSAWYYDDEGNLVEFTGNTFGHHDLVRHGARWYGPFSSEQAAVHVWEFRESERAGA